MDAGSFALPSDAPTGNYTVKVNAGKIAIQAAQSIELKVGGSSIKIEPAAITLKCGAATIKVEPAGITLQGPQLTHRPQPPVMATLQDILDLVLPVDDPSVDAALAAALPTADEPSQQLIVATLLERGRKDGVAALVGVYDTLPESLQQSLAELASTLVDGLRSAKAVIAKYAPLEAASRSAAAAI